MINVFSDFFNKISIQFRKKKVYLPLLSIILLGILYGGSYGIIQSTINNQMNSNNNSPDSKSDPMKLNYIYLISATEEYLDLNFSLFFPIDKSMPDISIKLIYFEIYHEGDRITDLSFPLLPFGKMHLAPSITSFNLTVRVGISNQIGINKMINHLVLSENVSLHVIGKFKLQGFGVIYPAFHLDQDFVLSSKQHSKKLLNFEFQSFEIDLDALTYSMEYTIKIFNPLNFSFNLLSVQGDLDFDDFDGVGLLGPKKNIHISTISYNWSENPFSIHANSENSKSVSFTDELPDIFTSSRLLDELDQNQLAIDVTKGMITIQWNDVILYWEFTLEDIAV
ncbi:hypothetical protein [Candidatus Harpocratesius sp.]